MDDRVLFVDDEANVVAGYRRHTRRDFTVETACSPKEGLAAVDSGESFAVVVSDLSMPGMNGIDFLSDVRDRAPDTVRVMLTGYADGDTATRAVNEGNVFRFLTKPVVPETLVSTLHTCVERYHLVVAERALLQDTLHGSIKVLTEVLSLVNPMAFRRAGRVKRCDPLLLDALEDLWRTEAGMQARGIVTGELRTGMILQEDLVAGNGALLVARGHEVTPTLLERLQRFTAIVGVREPFAVPDPGHPAS